MVPVKCGVRQGFVLSTDLFSLYSEKIIRSLDDLKGVSIGGHSINNLRYADDTVLKTHTEDDLQARLNELFSKSKHFGMEINSKKIEIMIFTKKAYNDAPQCNIYLNEKKLKQVEHFKYWGCTLSWDCREDKEMNTRLGQAESAFEKMKSILCSKYLSFKSRFRVVNCYIYPSFTYCSKTWNISRAMESRIQAFDMWCFRHMQKNSWRAKKSNELLGSSHWKREIEASISSRIGTWKKST